jgi:hypothetical protein
MIHLSPGVEQPKFEGLRQQHSCEFGAETLLHRVEQQAKQVGSMLAALPLTLLLGCCPSNKEVMLVLRNNSYY